MADLVQQLDLHLGRIVDLCEEIGGNLAAFLDHARNADRLARAIKAEAQHDRVKASDLIRMEERLQMAKGAMTAMLQSIQQSSVGSLL